MGFRSPGAGVVRVTTAMAGDVTANDAPDGGVGGGRRPGGMADGAVCRMGGIAGRVVSGDEAGANALGDAGAAPGIRAGAIAPRAEGAAGAPAGADDRAALGLPGIGAGWAPRGMPAGAIDGRPGGANGAAVPVALPPAGAGGRLVEDGKLGAKPGANAGRGAGAAPAGAPAGGTRTDEPGVGRSAGGAIGALPIPDPNGATGGTPRGGVTAGRAELAMLCATGAAGAEAAGRSPAVPGAETRWRGGAGWGVRRGAVCGAG